MKKYIGLTLFLLGAILLVYVFLFTKIHPKKSNSPKIVEASKVISQIKETNKTGNNINTGNEQNNVVVDTGLNLDEDFKKLEKIPVKKTLTIGAITLHYVNGDNTYDDIFDILGVSNLDKYKIDGKKIYIKKLDSIDYETEKINMKKLIQKIGGNIADVNRFGDKQLFVNLEPYYKKDSISLIEYNGNVYFMVLPYDKYYEYEKVIKEFLFIK